MGRLHGEGQAGATCEQRTVNVIPERLLADRPRGEMIPHEAPGSPTEIKCDFPFIRLKPEPARQ